MRSCHLRGRVCDFLNFFFPLRESTSSVLEGFSRCEAVKSMPNELPFFRHYRSRLFSFCSHQQITPALTQ